MAEYVDIEMMCRGRDVQTGMVARLAFSMIKGLKMAAASELLRRTGSPERLFSMTTGELAHVLGGRLPLTDAAYRRHVVEDALREAVFVKQHGIRPLFFEDKAYPARLRQCDDAPAMLYVLGDMDLDCPHMISVVGTRHATAYGVDFTEKIIGKLGEMLPGLGVISGLAYGIDISAHKASVDSGIATGAVLGHALDTIYPADHRGWAVKIKESGGALISEYPSGSQIHKGNFLARNRLVAGLSDLTLVVESDVKGGSLTTARLAREYNREVGAVPGRVNDTYSRGCNRLIAANVASMIRDAEDIIGLMGWNSQVVTGRQTPLPLTVEADPTEQKVLRHITCSPDDTVNEMCIALGMSFSELSSVLFRMEMNDMIVQLPGGKYAPASLR